ncbi:response regulator transcription factor [Shimazuella kribbensis]|uniref:response regulator transcription factor n=1 Tax=Shimazuella kribbensis TaxID=139808 RepID=UPI0003F96A32|nr:response regulator transcription factor [Shimazuella kribbensis]
MLILLVEDDKKLGFTLQYKMQQESHTVDWVTDGKTALDYINQTEYDLYIFDWMIPGESGIELVHIARKQEDHTPILLLTARDHTNDRVKGLLSGADDYLVKPFSFSELFARIHALGRRKTQHWKPDILCTGDLTVNLQTQETTRQGISISLTKREFQLVTFLLKHQGQILSREQIIDHVWGLQGEVTHNAVDATIKLLRKKVDSGFDQKLIESVRGFGYRIQG